MDIVRVVGYTLVVMLLYTSYNDSQVVIKERNEEKDRQKLDAAVLQQWVR